MDEAVGLYRKALKLKPSWEDGWWSLGSITYDEDKYAECALAFRRLAVLKPDLAAAWTMAGLCEYKLRKLDDAKESLTHAERLGFQETAELSKQARLHLAVVLTKFGSFERAIVLLTELTRLDRKTPEIITIAGIAGLRRPWLPSEVPEAERDKVLKLGDAMAAAMEQNRNAALEKFGQVLEAYPDDANIHFRYGAFLQFSDVEKGIAEIKKAIELEPEHIPAMVGLSTVYLNKGEVQQAREYAERGVKVGPGDFSARIALGRALLNSEDPTGAARELEAAVRFAPDNPEVHFSLAAAYAQLGRKADSERERGIFEKLKQNLPAGPGSLYN
jgi:tetratricopeptide (TPR) repeat protein